MRDHSALASMLGFIACSRVASDAAFLSHASVRASPLVCVMRARGVARTTAYDSEAAEEEEEEEEEEEGSDVDGESGSEESGDGSGSSDEYDSEEEEGAAADDWWVGGVTPAKNSGFALLSRGEHPTDAAMRFNHQVRAHAALSVLPFQV